MSETAFFYSAAKYCDNKGWLSIELQDNTVTTVIRDTSTPDVRVTSKTYKTARGAYHRYLFCIGQALRGAWKFDKFSWMKADEAQP